MDRSLLDYFGCPEEFTDVGIGSGLSAESGFFRFGQKIMCYGQCAGTPVTRVDGRLTDKSADTRINAGQVELPFDLTQVVDNLRYERYASRFRSRLDGFSRSNIAKEFYYFTRPFLPVVLRKYFQRAYLRGWEKIVFPEWPIDFSVDALIQRVLGLVMLCRGIERLPFIWFWPNGAPSCAIMTHDVEHAEGRNFCNLLMNLDDRFSIKSAFQIVPEARYETGNEFLDVFRDRGFEVNVHDLNHDGFLFREKREFCRRADKINRYAKNFGVEGFRSGAMYRNQDWYEAFDFSYDMSVPNVAHLEPQRGGCCTVMPYFIGKILELPLTTIQDYSLFHILGDYSINLWKQQIELIMQRHGLISFITHPDYLIEKRAQAVYVDLLSHLFELRDEKKLWVALPREVNHWWRNRYQMRLMRDGDQWRIEGPDSERARIAYATLEGDRIVYSVDCGHKTCASKSDLPAAR